MRRWVCPILILTASLGLAPSLCAQPQPAQRENTDDVEVKRIRAVRVPNATITIDGRLTEAEWKLAPAATGFTQQQPTERAPATEASEVRFLYDDNNLYIGGTFYESETNKLVVNELKRDFAAFDGDFIAVAFDTFNDKLNSYQLQTNPACALRDIQTYDDGRNINQNWDAVWSCRSSVADKAFFIEESIPFKQLRFPRNVDQVWGLNILRLIRHKYEHSVWSFVPRQYTLAKTSYEGVLEGISNVRPGRNMRVKPFATGGIARRDGINDTTGNGGVDVKIGLGSNLVLDATYRADFSQVEADAQQVNLTRFNLFFPEKREFFLENQGAFQVGGFGQSNNNLVPFFSRTVGLSDTGTPIPIVGGLRLSGKVGRNAIGVLNMQTEREDRAGLAPLPAANFTVMRYSREFLSTSAAGVFLMNKERGDISNRLVGSEVRFNLRRAINLDGLVMFSEKTGFGSGGAWRTGFNYDPGLTAYSVSYTSLGSTFKDDLGFIPREGVDILTASVLRRIRPRVTSRFIREFRVNLPYNRFTRDGVGVETASLAPAFTAVFPDASTAVVTFQRNEEWLDAPFRPQGIPAGQSIPVGRHLFNTGEFTYTSSNSRRLAPTGGYRFGGFYSGSRNGFSAGMRMRYSARLATTLTVSHDMIDVPGASFDTSLVSLRVDGAFSTRMFLNAYVQYNSVARQVISNVRYDFIHHPLSDIFVVFNETRSTAGNPAPPSRSVVLKITHLLSF